MHRQSWHRTLLPVGFVLVLLGRGNWYTGASKLREHREVLLQGRRAAAIEAGDDFSDFSALNARTNATLLMPAENVACPVSTKTRPVCGTIDGRRSISRAVVV